MPDQLMSDEGAYHRLQPCRLSKSSGSMLIPVVVALMKLKLLY